MLAFMAALVATAQADAVERPVIKAGEVTLGDYNLTRLYGTVFEHIPFRAPKSCNRKANQKWVTDGQIAVRSTLGLRVWVPVDPDVDARIKLCRVGRDKYVILDAQASADPGIGSQWRRKGPAFRGVATVVDSFHKLSTSIITTARVELIGTCTSGRIFREFVNIKPSMNFFGEDIVDRQGSAVAANDYVIQFLEKYAATNALLNFRDDWTCPEDVLDPDQVPPTTPAPVYSKPFLSCSFPEAWIIPPTSVYVYTSTGTIWCEVYDSANDPVERPVATSVDTKPSWFVPERTFRYTAPCLEGYKCFSAEYPLKAPGTYTFTVTATTRSGQQAVYKGSASVNEGYPSGGYK